MSRNWSYSRLNAFKCQRQYHNDYIAKLPPTWMPLPLEWGSKWHKLAEDYARHCFAQEPPVPADLAKAEKLASRHPDRGDELCSCFLSWVERTEFDWGLAMADGDSVERWLERELPNGDLFRGKLDMVLYDASAQQIITLDYKGTRHPPAYDAEEPPFQHRCYAWLAFGQWTPKSCIARCEYIRNTYEPVHEWELFPPLQGVEDSIMEQIAMIKEAEASWADDSSKAQPEYNPSGFCGTCKYLVGCPVWEQLDFDLSDTNQIAKAWNVAGALKAKGAAICDMLRDWLDENEAIYIDADATELLDRHPPQYTPPSGRVPIVRPGMTLRLLQRAQALGEKADKLASVGSEKLVKLIERYPDGEWEELLTEGRPSLTLGVRKVVVEAPVADEDEVPDLPEPTEPKPLE